MDLRQIRYFLTVAEERNITRAAERLHLSQPPLSRALMDLEEELGCTLIIRGKRHVTLTPEGNPQSDLQGACNERSPIPPIELWYEVNTNHSD